MGPPYSLAKGYSGPADSARVVNPQATKKSGARRSMCRALAGSPVIFRSRRRQPAARSTGTRRRHAARQVHRVTPNAYDAVLQQPDAALLLSDGIAEGMMQVVAQHVPPAA